MCAHDEVMRTCIDLYKHTGLFYLCFFCLKHRYIHVIPHRLKTCRCSASHSLGHLVQGM